MPSLALIAASNSSEFLTKIPTFSPSGEVVSVISVSGVEVSAQANVGNTDKTRHKHKIKEQIFCNVFLIFFATFPTAFFFTVKQIYSL